MATATILQADQLDNHEMKKLVEKTVEILKLSIVQGLNGTMNPRVYKFKPKEIKVGGRVPLKYPSAALVVADRLSTIAPQKLNAVRLSLGRDASITSAIRARGIDMRSEKSVGEQLKYKALFEFVNESNFGEAAMARMVADVSLLKEREIAPVREAVVSDLRAVDVRYGRLMPAGWMDDLLGRLGTGGGADSRAEQGIEI